VWMHRRVTASVVHFTFADVLLAGMPMDCCDLLCLAGLDEAPSRDAERVLQLLLQPGQPAREVLIHLDDAGLRRHMPWPATHAVVVSERLDCPELRRHQSAGGRLLTAIDGQLVLMTRTDTTVLSNLCSQTPLFAAAVEAWIARFFLKEETGPPRGAVVRAIA
jgi:hypothetical protein